MADLGTDIAGISDVSPALETVSGRLGLIQAIARRLITPRGALWYATDYGYDLRQYLSGITVAPASIASQVEAEAEKDERVEQASAVVSFAGDRLLVKLSVIDGSGPFEFTLAVSKVTSTLLSGAA